MHLYLSSEITKSAHYIAKDIGKPTSKKLVFVYTSYEYARKVPNWLKENRQSLISAGFKVSNYTITGK